MSDLLQVKKWKGKDDQIMPNPKARIYGALGAMYVDFGVFQGIVKLQWTIYCRPACPKDPPQIIQMINDQRQSTNQFHIGALLWNEAWALKILVERRRTDSNATVCNQ